ncbi:uncharacterized protein LOC135928962 [Gordionus sp. m RMFG-2023]|uniref:uncharacterized protein LOC135928962 n=1 Tax=Gordionus sp. m RMFG-2023 TaxID=3053472 RepID=UPI0031FC984B
MKYLNKVVLSILILVILDEGIVSTNAKKGKDVQLGDKLNCSEGNQRQKRNNILEMGGLLFEHRIKKRDQRPRLTINLTLSELYTRIAAFRPYKPYQEVNQQEQDNTA